MTKKNALNRALTAVQESFHDYFNGNNDTWFSYLCKESTCISTGEPALFGGDAIASHFNSYSRATMNILHEEYYPACLSSDIYIVFGKFSVCTSNNKYRLVVDFTVTLRVNDEETSFLHQHNSYGYFQMKPQSEEAPISDLLATNYVRNLLLEYPFVNRVPIRSANQTIIVNPYTIMYVESMGKKTNVVCLDRIINSCNTMSELKELLPDTFYMIHRSYYVNTRYITSIQRFEVSLLSGRTLPIPEKEYTRVKADLVKMMGK